MKRCLARAVVIAALAAASATAAETRHLIYLHGRIVQEQQSARPQHPQYGYYELDMIRDTFRKRGFIASADLRQKSATVRESADRVIEQVRTLLGSGVPADRITVVGASMGASIAFLVSTRLQNTELRFVFIGACFSANDRALLAEHGKGPSGRLLSIRDTSDELTAGCEPWKNERRASVPAYREVVLSTGLNHGFIYRPLPEWVDPVVEWVKANKR